MNLPNKLTMLRIFMIPIFVFFALCSAIPGNTYIALAIFIIASLTDLLDGKIARAKNLVTNFGKFMDPLADKLLVTSALLCLLVMDGGARICSNQTLALIAILIIVAREFIISGFRLVASDAGLVIAASIWGKFKTATTMVSICLMLVVKELPIIKEVSLVMFWIAVTLTLVSLVDYLIKNASVMADSGIGSKKKKSEEPVKSEPAEELKPKFDPETGKPLE